MKNGTVNLKLSQPQHTDAGRVLGDIYYRTGMLDLFDRDHRFGYPHNGGEHTLTLVNVNPVDVEAWLDLVDETFGDRGKSFTLPSRAILQEATDKLH